MDAVLRTLLSLGLVASVCQAAVLSFLSDNAPEDMLAKFNKDARYGKWLDPKRILYRLDEHSYSQQEKDMIMLAMSQLAADMNKCISFQEYDAAKDAGLDNIYISKTLNDGSIPPTCFTFYGRLLRAAGQGQKMAIHDGQNGCMDSLRDIMKMLINVLGVRNEYNRPDRDDHIKVFHENLQQELRNSNLLNVYNASQVDFDRMPFDYDSITFPSPSQWAVEHAVWYEFPANHEIPKLEHLSKSDCIGLSWMYGCDESKCLDHYNVIPAALHESVKVDGKEIALSSSQAPITELPTMASSSLASTAAMTTTAIHMEESSTAAHVDTTLAALTTEATTMASTHAAMIESSSLASSTAAALTTMAAESTHHMEEVSSSTTAPLMATSAPVALNLSLADVIFARIHADNASTQAAAQVTALPTIPAMTSTMAAVTQAAANASEMATTQALMSTMAAVTQASANVSEMAMTQLLSSTMAAVTEKPMEISTQAATTAAQMAMESSTLSHELLNSSVASSTEEPGLKMIILKPQINHSQLSFAAVEIQSVNVTDATTTVATVATSQMSSTQPATVVAVETTAAGLNIISADNINVALSPKFNEELVSALSLPSQAKNQQGSTIV